MSIPLADLIPNGVKVGQPFYMNVFRATPMPAENMSWSPIFVKSFHDLNRLAEFTLEPPPAGTAAFFEPNSTH